MSIEYRAKSSTVRRGLGILNNGGQKTIVICHGIDERNDESAAGIKRNVDWGGWKNLIALANKYLFNIIWTNSNEENTTDEIDYAIEVAENELKTKNLHGLGYSWGGRRWKLWTSRNLEGAKKLRSLMRVSSGGVDVDDWTNIIAAQLPTWLLHAVDDGRTSYTNSLVTFQNARKVDPAAPVYYTEFIAGLDTTFNGHNMLKMVGEWQIAQPSKTKAATGYTNNSQLNIIQWWEMNEWKRPTAPETKYVSKPVEEPVPIPEPLPPTKTLLQTIKLYSDNTYEIMK